MFILVNQVPKVVFYFKVKKWLQLSSCGMTRIPTMVAWCLPALLAVSIITCLLGIYNISTGNYYLPRTISAVLINSPWRLIVDGVSQEQCWVDCLLFPNPPVPRGIIRKSIRGLSKRWWCEQAGISSRIWPVPNIHFLNWAVTCHRNHRSGSAGVM